MFRHFLRRTFQTHTAGIQQIGVIAAFERKLDILLHEENGNAGFGQVENDAENLMHDLRREPQRWLVQHQELRLRHQGAAYGEHLLLATGHAARHTVAPLLQYGKEVEDFLTQRLEAFLAAPDMSGDEIFLDRQALEYLPPFRAMGQPHAYDLFGTRAGNVLAFEPDGTGRRARHARNGIEQRRLARAVRPQDDDDLMFADLQVDAFKNADPPVSRAEPGDLEQRL